MTTMTSKPQGPSTEPSRAFNFSAGPAVLPESVLRQTQRDIWSFGNTGVGIMEHSHRGPAFDGVIAEAEADCRTLAGVGDDHAVLFLQGGATTQFALLPMNFLPPGRSAEYIDTGVWARKAIAEALRAPDIVQKAHTGGLRVTYLGPADFRTTITNETRMFGDIIKKGNIKI